MIWLVVTGTWLDYFSMTIGNNHPIWLIFFQRGRSTTNQKASNTTRSRQSSGARERMQMRTSVRKSRAENDDFLLLFRTTLAGASIVLVGRTPSWSISTSEICLDLALFAFVNYTRPPKHATIVDRFHWKKWKDWKQNHTKHFQVRTRRENSKSTVQLWYRCWTMQCTL